VPRQFLLLDVDNTLYARTCGVVERVDERINRYLVERLGLHPAEVDDTRKRLWSDYGTTLHGLMVRGGIDPDDYLGFVHAIDLGDVLSPDPALAAMLARIPLVKVAVTNGSLAHARGVLDRLGVLELFFRLYTLERLAYLPKPYPQAYQTVLADLHARGADCVLVEDSAPNLRAARQLGMRTLYVADGRPPPADADAVIHSILDLEEALARVDP
jgi:putative hydrolase of the HAD superfamily